MKITEIIEKKLILQIALLPLGIAIPVFIFFSIGTGPGSTLINLQNSLKVFLFFEAFFLFVYFLLSGLLAAIFKQPIIISLGLIINLIYVVYKRPYFLYNFYPLGEDFPLIIIAILGLLMFPIVSPKNLREKKFVDEIPEPILVMLIFSVYSVLFLSSLLLLIVDFLMISFKF